MAVLIDLLAAVICIIEMLPHLQILTVDPQAKETKTTLHFLLNCMGRDHSVCWLANPLAKIYCTERIWKLCSKTKCFSRRCIFPIRIAVLQSFILTGSLCNVVGMQLLHVCHSTG